MEPAPREVLMALVTLKVSVAPALLELLVEPALLRICRPDTAQGARCAVAVAAHAGCSRSAGPTLLEALAGLVPLDVLVAPVLL